MNQIRKTRYPLGPTYGNCLHCWAAGPLGDGCPVETCNKLAAYFVVFRYRFTGNKTCWLDAERVAEAFKRPHFMAHAMSYYRLTKCPFLTVDATMFELEVASRRAFPSINSKHEAFEWVNSRFRLQGFEIPMIGELKDGEEEVDGHRTLPVSRVGQRAADIEANRIVRAYKKAKADGKLILFKPRNDLRASDYDPRLSSKRNMVREGYVAYAHAYRRQQIHRL